jgi:hypothetical protein
MKSLTLLTIRLKIKDFQKTFVLLYYFILLLAHYVVIGRVLPYPQSGADISTHLKHAENLILNRYHYNAYYSLGFHALLSTLYVLNDRYTIYQIAGVLIFVNMVMMFFLYVFVRRLFSLSATAFFATLLISGGNFTWIRLLPCIYMSDYVDSYKCFNPFEALLFNSLYNISNYFLIQFTPVSLSLTLIYFLLPMLTNRNWILYTLNKVLVILVIAFIYLIHPLYAIILPFFIIFMCILAYYLKEDDQLSDHSKFLFLSLCGSGFIPSLIAYLADNSSPTYRFQVFMFSLLNAVLSLIVFAFLKNVCTIIERFRSTFFPLINLARYFFVIVLSIYAYSLYLLHSMKDLNAWSLILQPTPIWLYPVIIGVGPLLIIGLAVFSKNKKLDILLMWFLVFPFLFVIVAPLIDYINFSLLGFYIGEYFMYSGVTSGRLLALANLLYSITAGCAVGYSFKKNSVGRYKVMILATVTMMIVPNIIVSLKYWSTIYQLLLPKLHS